MDHRIAYGLFYASRNNRFQDSTVGYLGCPTAVS